MMFHIFFVRMDGESAAEHHYLFPWTFSFSPKANISVVYTSKLFLLKELTITKLEGM